MNEKFLKGWYCFLFQLRDCGGFSFHKCSWGIISLLMLEDILLCELIWSVLKVLNVFVLQALFMSVIQIHVPWGPCCHEHLAGEYKCFLCSYNYFNQCTGFCLRSICCYQLWCKYYFFNFKIPSCLWEFPFSRGFGFQIFLKS